MNNEFKNWISATKNDEESLKVLKTFLKLILLSTEDKMIEYQSEAQLILNYLESDEVEVPRRVEMSVVNILKLIAGDSDPNNEIELFNLRKTFEEKSSK